jgi:hypothetical protein
LFVRLLCDLAGLLSLLLCSGRGLLLLGAQVLFARLIFVKRNLARQTVARLARLAIEDFPVVFGEEGA